MAVELSEMLLPREAAVLLGLSRQGVDVQIATGRLPCVIAPGGTRLINRADVEALAAKRAAAPKDALGRPWPTRRGGQRKGAKTRT